MLLHVEIHIHGVRRGRRPWGLMFTLLINEPRAAEEVSRDYFEKREGGKGGNLELLKRSAEIILRNERVRESEWWTSLISLTGLESLEAF